MYHKPLIVYGHMSPYMLVGMIGAIKAGCGYVPIDTSVPSERDIATTCFDSTYHSY
jgi:D-alanine--poly(phosphoribitol) ligase subunit 1